MLHLRTINNQFSVRNWPIELVIDRKASYCYLIYDDGKKYNTKSVLVPRINDLSLLQWVEAAEEFRNEMK